MKKDKEIIYTKTEKENLWVALLKSIPRKKNKNIFLIFLIIILQYSCSNKLNEEEYIRHNYLYYKNHIDDNYKSKLDDSYSLLMYNYVDVYNALFYFEKINDQYFLTKFNFQDCKIYYRQIDSNTFLKIANSLIWIENYKFGPGGCSHNSHDEKSSFSGRLMYEYAVIKYSNKNSIFSKFCNESKDNKNGLLQDESTNYLLSIITESELNQELYKKVIRFEEFFSKEIIEKSKIIED